MYKIILKRRLKIQCLYMGMLAHISKNIYEYSYYNYNAKQENG